MNNRYLYRAKRTDNGEWAEGNLIHAKKDYYICKNPYECMDEYSSLNGQSYGFGGFKFVDPSTICRCTGLKDKNGKLIFENDIVAGKMYLDHGQWGESVDDKRIVEWDDDYARFIPCSYMKLDKYEVIGNIFDNPELLEVGE